MHRIRQYNLGRLCGILTLLTESSYKSVVLRGIVTKNYPHEELGFGERVYLMTWFPHKWSETFENFCDNRSFRD